MNASTYYMMTTTTNTEFRAYSLDGDEATLIGTATTLRDAAALLPRGTDGLPEGQVQEGADGAVHNYP